MLNLTKLFESFHSPIIKSNEENLISAIPIPGYEPHRLGKDMHGFPLILLSVLDDKSRANPAPITLDHIAVLHNVECQISGPNGNMEAGKFTIIRCIDGDLTLQTYFLHILNTIVVSLNSQPTSQDVARVIKILVELFRAMTRSPKKSIQGLWAELYFIARSTQPTILVDAWHVRPEDRYDFSLGNQSIEIKSTSHQVRQHHFSLEQLHPPLGIEVLIASVFVERTQTGQSLLELLEKIRDHLIDRPDLVLHLDEIVGLTLGSGWRHALQERFDDKLAEESLMFYDVATVPSVNPEMPSGVSNVHFLSDLTELQTANLFNYRNRGGLFEISL
ncbi:MAG: PD-(D/E)XK motif protein [Candidatus Promineifilaceae bacterium]